MTQGIVPFRQFVLKVHSRCDLACDHCYVYEHSDQSWRGRPKDGISGETAAYAARRIAEHAQAHGLAEVHVILHGGEPLLLGVERTREVLAVFRETIAPVTRLVLRMHTNGVLLSEEFLDLLLEYDVRIGVSLDGGRAANDLHRIDRRGRSSYDRVAAALELLRRPAYRRLYSGLLCTIDLRNDPVEAFEALLGQQPPRIDFLLPHATWEHQPQGLAAERDLGDPKGGSAPYARWLGDIFAAWDRSGRGVPIRTFDSVLAALHGRPSGTESLGLVPADLLVIETDGTLEQADWLKTAYEGAAATGFDVFDNSLDEAAAHAGIMARQHGLDDLCDTCQACPVVAVCGGGLYVHRFNPGTGFQNPSVYCPDLLDLIGQISQVEDSRIAVRAEAGAGGAESDRTEHALGQADFDALCAGYGDADAIGALADAQKSIRRDLLARLAVTGPQDNRLFTAAWDHLASLDEVSPQTVDQALSHPFVRAWAVHCLMDPAAGQTDAAHLAAVTASAYLLGGFETNLSLSPRNGNAYLPGCGSLGAADGAGDLGIETLTDQRLIVTTGGKTREIAFLQRGADVCWQPVRRLQAKEIEVVLDDLDGYRDCFPNPAPRLSEADFARWQGSFPAAIAFIDEHLPEYAPSLRAGLTTVVPLLPSADGKLYGRTDRHAFGAVGAALPDDPALLALLLVRGFQEVKFGAMLDLYDLHNDAADADQRCYAPWSPDPQPVGELLKGAYTRVAVTEFWRARRLTGSGEGAATAETQFSRSRTHTAEAIGQLLGSGLLTALGERMALAIGETVAPWLNEPVSPSVVVAAQRTAAEHRAGYEERLRAGR
jgi:uncharacterized protein